jgi:HPt (histidine-containing phosphotransfer) domain-containing protein
MQLYAPTGRDTLDAELIADIRAFDDSLLDRFIERFLRDVHFDLATAWHALRVGRLEEVVRLAHKVVNSAGNVGATRACAVARATEEAAARGERGDTERSLFRLEAECAEAARCLEAMLSRRSVANDRWDLDDGAA